jgi:nucleoside-diphosphate-sugar epimerase
LRKGKFPYVILRLPDVLGERDSSNRFWYLQMYLEYLEYLRPNERHSIEIASSFWSLKTSYVCVKDVARAVTFFIKSDIKNEIFNIGILHFLLIKKTIFRGSKKI